jgi:S-adenosylmethionine:tRNA ribosyltransferase-isomerase
MEYIPKARTEDYSYDLPEERIAKYPLGERDKSKLLLADAGSGTISHHTFLDISELLPANSLLVVNNTKVIQARFNLQKPTGGKAELLCVEPRVPSRDPQIAMKTKNSTNWICIVGGRKINEGISLSPLGENPNNLKATLLERIENEALVEFSWSGNKTFSEIVEDLGKIPLPPYIKREAEEKDKSAYQTVYAEKEGSIAAPTAGLHFTESAIRKVKAKGIDFAEVVLHVGPGTFKPVESDDISEHDMHSERISVSKDLIVRLISRLENNNKIIATGTTSLRTLESVYWIGALIHSGELESLNFRGYAPKQWDSYRLGHEGNLPSTLESLESILELLEKEDKTELVSYTQLLIVPGYKFRLVDALITNYHLPKSTLILLVAAFVGKDFWREIYKEALDNDYRFLSYGDSSLLIR